MTDRKVVKISVKTGRRDAFDLTEQVDEIVRKSGIKCGGAIIQSLHTTAVVVVQEKESGLIRDFFNTLERIAPEKGEYRHNNFKERPDVDPAKECPNGHSHCQALFFPPSLVVIVEEGKLRLGQWQRILLLELDETRQEREVAVEVFDKIRARFH